MRTIVAVDFIVQVEPIRSTSPLLQAPSATAVFPRIHDAMPARDFAAVVTGMAVQAAMFALELV